MARPTLKLMIYVQNLLGIGHLRRAAAIARAAASDGFAVAFVSGGMPVPDLDLGGATLHQLPPVRALDEGFKTLVDAEDRPIDDAWRQHRRDQLLHLFDQIAPDVLVTELFPFGRRQLRFELIPLLERATARAPRPVIISSMRDILVTKPRAERNLEIVETIEKYYDRVLVHGDAEIITLAETFPLHDRIAHLLTYTGYVVNPPAISPETEGSGEGAGAGEILVSAGGGAVGRATMETLFHLRPRTDFADQPWRFVTGPHMAAETVAFLMKGAGGSVIVEQSRPDLSSLFRRAPLSISQAGYNTVAELMAAGTPALVIPFEGGVETEQRLRADLLARRGRLAVLPEDALDADSLNRAMHAAMHGGGARGGGVSVALNGAARTAAIMRDLAEAGTGSA